MNKALSRMLDELLIAYDLLDAITYDSEQGTQRDELIVTHNSCHDEIY